MKVRIKKWIRPILFTISGMLAGLSYHYFVGCSTGSCAILSHPVSAMVYMGLIGWLLSGVFEKECEDACSM